MKFVDRFAGVLLAGLLLALPLLCGETRPGDTGSGGSTNGGTAVWILPRSSSAGFLASVTAISAPRATSTLSLTGNPLVLKTAPDVVNPVATLVDRQTQQNLPIQVQGEYVTIAAATLAQIAATPGTIADCIIIDASARGYAIKITAVTAQTLTLEVF